MKDETRPGRATAPRPGRDIVRAVSLPVLRSRTPADLQRAREKIPWIDDDEVRDLETKSPVGAAALGLFTWGGGRLYVGDGLRGGLAIAALIAWLAAGAVVPATIGGLVYWGVGTLSAIWSYLSAKAINRFVSTATELRLRAGPDPSAYRLLAAAATAQPGLAAAIPSAPAPAASADGRHADLVDRLRKVAALGHAGVLHEAEVRDRKIDLLSAVTPGTRVELDELLFALLPLRDEGVLSQEDYDFVKRLGGDL